MAEQLSPLDATFLELEQADQSAHMHIGAILVFAPPEHGGPPTVERLRRHLDARLYDLPRYRQRLSTPATGGLRWPTWTPVDGFDIAKHVRRARLPGRGTDADLRDWAGEFFSERLDRARPLWELVLITGLEGGRWALASKTHHCMVDGVGSVDAGLAILDTEPNPKPPPRRAAAHDGAGEGEAGEPEGGEGTVPRLLGLPRRLAGATLRAARGGLELATHPDQARELLARAQALAEVIVRDELIAAPRTSLNSPISAKRRIGVEVVELDELRAIKRALGGTVNDVVLAVAAGGLRSLLLARDEALPEPGLRAMVPVNLRSAAERLALGNRVTSLFVHLPVAEADPARRYARQVDEAESLKSSTQALGTSSVLDLAGMAPPVLHIFLAQSLYATRLFNVTITNVPGPQAPLYALGSRLEAIWPLVPLAAEHALGLAVFSYDGRLFFTVNADLDAVPDLDVMLTGMRDSLAELSELAAQRS
jgi:diacylglycerol O-acyltransferase / wax synthase